MDGALYRTTLNKRLPPDYAPDCSPNKQGEWLFLQDNDPKHKAKETSKLLDEIAGNRIRDFPANSPDLNVGEDIWSHLDRRLQRHKIKSIATLKKKLREEWENVDWETIRTSVDSMPRRLNQCIERNGDRTNY